MKYENTGMTSQIISVLKSSITHFDPTRSQQKGPTSGIKLQSPQKKQKDKERMKTGYKVEREVNGSDEVEDKRNMKWKLL